MDYLITSYLYSAYPKLKPGQLTDLRSLSVNNKAFACVAVDRRFDKFILCDSSGLSEAIKNYVDYIRRSVSCSCVKEGPKCPKVDVMIFLLQHQDAFTYYISNIFTSLRRSSYSIVCII